MTIDKNKKQKSWWWAWLILGAVVCFFTINHSVFDPIKQPLTDFLNSNFSTAFFGAVGGSLAIMAIEWFRRQRQVLADINTSLGLFASLSNTLLNIKKQHALPLLLHYQNNVRELQIARTIRKYAGTTQETVIIEVPMHMQRFNCPNLHFDIPTDRLFTLTDKMPSIVHVISQAKRAIGEVESICAAWNRLAEDFKDLPQEEKISAYFGLRTGKANEDIADTYCPDTIQNVSKVIDDALFFINLSIKSLAKLSEKTLPFWLKKKVAKSEIVIKEYKALLPPDNHLEGWYNE